MALYDNGLRAKRFIAGTVCPKCSKMDTTRMFKNDNGDDVRECVSCGFVQTLSQQLMEDEAKAAELATRVSPFGDKAILDEGEKPLKIIGFSNPQS
ncbi:MAG: YheV family putative zinc ribbon protein [Venatoribacter sp.]